MRIAVDGLLYGPKAAGIGHYIRHLFTAYGEAFPDDDLVMALPSGQRFPGSEVFHPLSSADGSDPGSRRRLLYEHLRLSSDFRRRGYDVAHFPDYQMPWGGLPRSVITIHDLVAFLFPETFTPAATRVKQTLMKRSVRLARRIIVPSLATRDDLVDRLHVDPEHVSVVPHGVVAPTTWGPRPHERPYWLFVSTLEPRKNLVRLIRAYRIIRERHQDAPDLVIAGKPGWLYEPVYQEAARVGQDRPVIFLGYVPDSTIGDWYRHAVAFCFPTLYEGFGLPVLEAMAAACPVITADRGAVTEIARDVGLLVDPDSVEAIADAMEHSWRNPASLQEGVARGLERARTATWARSARETRQVYERVRVEEH